MEQRQLEVLRLAFRHLVRLGKLELCTLHPTTWV